MKLMSFLTEIKETKNALNDNILVFSKAGINLKNRHNFIPIPAYIIFSLNQFFALLVFSVKCVFFTVIDFVTFVRVLYRCLFFCLFVFFIVYGTQF